jgi:hypothetical protein
MDEERPALRHTSTKKQIHAKARCANWPSIMI